MKTQQDHKIRLLALDNLEAICKRASGWAHTFTIDKVTRSRVHVSYSNPSEYGTPNPITVVFPCYPSGWDGDEDNPRVLLDAIRVYGGREDNDREYGYQCVDAQIINAPTLFRNSVPNPNPTLAPDTIIVWESHSEILKRQNRATRENDINGRCVSCVVCDVVTEEK